MFEIIRLPSTPRLRTEPWRHPTAPSTSRAGLVAMGRDYADLALETTAGATRPLVVVCRDADAGGREALIAALPLVSPAGHLRLSVDEGAIGRFSFSRDGHRFEPLGDAFTAKGGVWVGARVGLFALSPAAETPPVHADFDWFRVEQH